MLGLPGGHCLEQRSCRYVGDQSHLLETVLICCRTVQAIAYCTSQTIKQYLADR